MQLSLFSTLQEERVYYAEDYVPLAENQQTYNLLLNGDWDVLLLHGDRGSGKTHLSYLWQKIYDARFIIIESFIEQLHYAHAFILEDIHTITNELQFLHCFNYLKEHKKRLLMTSSVSPGELQIDLKDLSSRIIATINAPLVPPNEELLKIALIQQFSYRQLQVELKVINYILKNIERSFVAINSVAKIIDEESRAYSTNVTIPFVKSIIVGQKVWSTSLSNTS